MDKSKREFVNFKPRKGSGGGDSSGKKAKGSSLPVITEMWRPDAALTPLFTDAGAFFSTRSTCQHPRMAAAALPGRRRCAVGAAPTAGPHCDEKRGGPALQS